MMVTTERLEEMWRIHARNRDLGGYLPEKVRQMNADMCAALRELVDYREAEEEGGRLDAAADPAWQAALAKELSERQQREVEGWAKQG